MTLFGDDRPRACYGCGAALQPQEVGRCAACKAAAPEAHTVHHVTLTDEQMAAANAEAARVLEWHRVRDTAHRFGKDDRQSIEKSSLHHHEGSRSELAVAVLVGGRWTGRGVLRGVDVTAPDGTEIEVRWASYLYGLSVYKRDPAHRLAVLVTGRNGSYTIHGCFPCGEAREHPEWRGERYRGWVVPVEALRPLIVPEPRP